MNGTKLTLNLGINPMCRCNAEIEDTEHFLLRCHFYSIQRFELLNNIKKNYFPFTQLHTKEQVNILLYGYLSNKSNAFNQDIIKIIINFLEKSDRLDKPLISFNQCFYVLLFLFLPICLFYVITSLLENNCKFVACNWLKIF